MSQPHAVDGQLTSPNPEEFLGQLQAEGWAPVQSQLGSEHYSELTTIFRAAMELVTQPDGEPIREAFSFNSHGSDHTDFYLQRKFAGQANPLLPDYVGTDSKDLLHYGALTSSVVRDRLSSKMPPEIADLLEICDETLGEVFRIGQEATRALGIEPLFFSGNPKDWTHIFRGLDYHAGDVPYLGDGHFDRSGATATLYEEIEGLEGVQGQNGRLESITAEYLDELEQSMQPLEYVEYVARFFFGAGFNELPQAIRERLGSPNLFAHQIANRHPHTKRASFVGFFNPHPGFRPYKTPTQIHTGFAEIKEHLEQTGQ